MTRLLPFATPLLLAWALLLVTNLRAETLRQVLQQNAVPFVDFTSAELDSQFDSGAVTADAGNVLIAYPTPGADQTIGSPLRVVVYDRSTQKLSHRSIAAAETSDECFGSVWGITKQAEYLLIVTHINPSALCTLVLDSDLRVRHTLLAWSIASLGPRTILLEEGEVHFAAVHPLRLEIFDLATGRAQEVYPPDGDPLRAQFSRDLAQHLPPKSWCTEHDHPCDPASFDEGLVDSAFADSAANEFAFIARYDARRFGDEAARAIPARSVMYVYRRSQDGWTYCQQALFEVGVEPALKFLKQDLAAATKTCMTASKVTVTPVESPFSHLQ